MACKAFKTLGMVQVGPDTFSRHPLAFLTEAADDACYAIADIDDALKLGILRYDDARDAVLRIAERDPGFREPGYPDDAAKFSRIRASCLARISHQGIEKRLSLRA
jgi:dGTPase